MSNWKNIDDLYIFNILRKVPKSVYVFCVTLITGFLTNGFAMSGSYVNGDGMNAGPYYLASNWDISQGRWGRIFFSHRFVLSWFDGLLTLIILGIATIYIIKILEIKSVSLCILVSMLMATQTHFAQWQGSFYLLLPYAVSFVGAILAVWLCDCAELNLRGIVRFVAAVLLLTFSIGLYQSYLPIATTLILMRIIRHFMSHDSLKQIIKKGLLYMGMGICAGGLYYGILRLSLIYYNVELTTARGFAEAMEGRVPILSSPRYTLKSMYRLFIELLCGKGEVYHSFTGRVVYFALFAVLLYCICYWLVQNRRYCVDNVMMCICIILFPVAVVLLRMITETVIPWSMFPGIIFVPIGIIAFYDKVSEQIRGRVLIQWLIAGCGLFLILEAMYISNIDYSNLKIRYEKTFAASIRLLDAVEYTDGYTMDTPVIFIGTLSDTYENPLTQYETVLQGYEAYIMDFLPFHETGSRGWHVYIRNNLGVKLKEPNDYNSLYSEICDSDWIDTLEAFPAKGCTGFYGDVLVVKLSEVR